jgi:N6-adenosine-specific RNA methylase IME4
MFDDLSPPYTTIVADPPWMYQKQPGGQMHNYAEAKYGTMTHQEIADLPVGALAAADAHVFMWVTNPELFGGRFSRVDARDIVEAWGFEYRTLITWVKTGPIGMGWYFRGQTEHVVYATRGRAGIPAEKRRENVIRADRRAHSQKPPSFLDMVEAVCPGPYIELFARQPRFGWDSWGHGYELPTAAGR